MPTKITEAEMAATVKSILAHRPNKSATFDVLRETIPKRVKLSRADRTKSPSRPGEEVWEQILRNLISHKHEGFVSIKGGIKLQWRQGSQPSSSEHEARRVA